MAHTIQLPAILRPLADGQRSLEASGNTVGEIFADIATRYPKLAQQLTGGDGGLPVFVNVFLNDDDIRYLDGLATPAEENSEITILPAVAGGSQPPSSVVPPPSQPPAAPPPPASLRSWRRKWGPGPGGRWLDVPPTPLVQLARIAPPHVRLYAKCEWHLPTGSVKDRIAGSMLAAAKADGLISPGIRLLEPSSGNTGIALARLAALEGLSITVVVPDNVSSERIDLLSAYGSELVFSPGEEGSNGAVRMAQRMSVSGDYVMLNQYENRANPEAHYLTTGPEILSELERVDAFVACLGTGGTLMGVGRALRQAFPQVKVVAAEPPAGESISGLRSLADGYLPPVFDPAAIDRKVLVRTAEAVKATKRLLNEEGIFAGPSSGAAVHASLKVANALPAGSVVVTLFPDGGWKYLSTGIYGDTADADTLTQRTLW